MAQIPFVAADKQTVANAGTISHSYKAPNNQSVIIHQIFFVIVAAFDLIRISDDRGNEYGQISTVHPIPSSELPQSNTDVKAVNLPAVPLVLPQGTTLTVELLDTGGGAANTVIFNGEMTVPG